MFEVNSRNIAYELVNLLQDVSSDSLIKKLGVGSYSGLSSILKGLLHISIYLNDNYILEFVKKYTRALADKDCSHIKEFDMVYGLSGLLSFLCTLQSSYRDLALQGQIANISSIVDKVEHKTKNSGYAHGITGIGYSLCLSGQINRDQSLLKKGMRLVIDDSRRIISSTNSPNLSWCRGVAGVGNVLLQSQDYSNEIPSILELAIQLSLNKIQNLKTDTLCCGKLGVLDFLISAKNNQESIVAKYGHQIEDILKREFKTISKKMRLETPNEGIPNLSLFRGVSGYFYTMLRWKYPNKINSIMIQ